MAQDETPATDASKEDAPLTTTATNAILPKAVPRWQEACGAFDVSFAGQLPGDVEPKLREASASPRGAAAAAEVLEAWLGALCARDASRSSGALRAFADDGGDGGAAGGAARFLLLGVDAAAPGVPRRSKVSGVAWLEAGEAAQWQWSLKTGGPKHQDVRFSARFLAGGERGLMARGVAFGAHDDARFAPGAVVVEADRFACCDDDDAECVGSFAAPGAAGSRFVLRAAAQAPGALGARGHLRRRRGGGGGGGRRGERRAAAAAPGRQRVASATASRVAPEARLRRVAVASDDELLPPAKRTSVTGLHVRDKLKAALGRTTSRPAGGSARGASGSASSRPSSRTARPAPTRRSPPPSRAGAARDRGAVPRAQRASSAAESGRARGRPRGGVAGRPARPRRLRAPRLRAAAADQDHNPFASAGGGARARRGPASTMAPDRAWALLACGDEAVDAAAGAARAAAAAAAADAAGSRAAAGARRRRGFADERRVLVAEFRRLKAASDERVAGALDEVLKTQDDDRMRALKRKLDAAVRKLEVQLARLDEAAAGDDSPRTSIAGADGTTLL
ncbi:hypothetical protein JL721_11718 [Aureococcus anophagefferens]|nr:hypothetical protein JL721_11718 [Aureococcus anophagefferens]